MKYLNIVISFFAIEHILITYYVFGSFWYSRISDSITQNNLLLLDLINTLSYYRVRRHCFNDILRVDRFYSSLAIIMLLSNLKLSGIRVMIKVGSNVLSRG